MKDCRWSIAESRFSNRQSKIVNPSEELAMVDCRISVFQSAIENRQSQ